MLKIKDNIDIKELEKYGFEYCKDEEEDFQCYGKVIGTSKGKLAIMYVDLKGTISFCFPNRYISSVEEDEEYDYIDLDDTLYNLIQGGIVGGILEKVEK